MNHSKGSSLIDLHSRTIHLINLPSTNEKNIAGKELINKFNKAKSEIINSIINEHKRKVKKLNDLISNLRTYQIGFNNVIPNEYQSECIQLNEPVVKEPIKKVSFEM